MHQHCWWWILTGGAFAHVVEYWVLDPDERALIRGVVINKFRGQRSLLEPGISWLEERTGIPLSVSFRG